jgi:hypothetical protein
MNETHILIRLLWTYIPRNWEFGSALAKLRNFGEGLNPTNPTPRYATVFHCQSIVACRSQYVPCCEKLEDVRFVSGTHDAIKITYLFKLKIIQTFQQLILGHKKGGWGLGGCRGCTEIYCVFK